MRNRESSANLTRRLGTKNALRRWLNSLARVLIITITIIALTIHHAGKIIVTTTTTTTTTTSRITTMRTTSGTATIALRPGCNNIHPPVNPSPTTTYPK